MYFKLIYCMQTHVFIGETTQTDFLFDCRLIQLAPFWKEITFFQHSSPRSGQNQFSSFIIITKR